MIRPTPASSARSQLGRGLVVAVVADPGRVEARAQRDGQLTGAAHVEAQSLLGDPARDRRAQEGLARVVDVVRRRTPSRNARARDAEVGLVEHVRRRAVLGDQVGQRRRRRPRARRRRACARWTTTACGTSALGSLGLAAATTARGRRPQRVPSRPRAPSSNGHIRSGAVTPSRSRPFASTVRVALDQHAAGRRCSSVELLVALRQHPARVVEPVVTPTRCPPGSARPGAAPAAAPQPRPPAGTRRAPGAASPSFSWVEQRGSNSRSGSTPRSRGVAQERRRPRVRVLHVEHRVVARLPRHLRDVEGQRRVGRVARQRVAQRVDADQVDQLRQRDERAGPLGQLELLAVLEDLHQLADHAPRCCGPGRRRRRRPSRAAGRRSRGGRRRAGRCTGRSRGPACRGSTPCRWRSRSARRWTGSAPGPCRRRSRWCASRPHRRRRRRGPGRAASPGCRPRTESACSDRSENQTSKWVRKVSSDACCSASWIR